jgi:hypothetical protein
MLAALSAYAREHGDAFPASGNSALQDLQLLYPKYSGSDAAILAGISGDERMVKERIAGGGLLDDEISSWVYVAGFRLDDDPRVAIIWERADGVAFNGSRSRAGSHAVGFVDGSFEQIGREQWSAFLKEQEDRRRAVLTQRTATRRE